MDPRAEEILRAKSFAFLSLVDDAGRPHVSPVWVDLEDDGLIVINTAEGRKKAQLLQQGAAVALCAVLPENLYQYALIFGEVVERTHQGAEEVIHALSRKYTGNDFEIPEGMKRVTVRIRPDKETVYG